MNFRLLANPDLFEVGAEPWLKMPKDTALGRLMRHNLTLMNGEKHRQDRRLMQPAFHKQQIVHYRDDMVTLTQQLIERWQEKSRIDLLLEMRKLTQRIAVRTLFGLDNEAELERVGVLMRKLTSLSPLLAVPINVPGTPYHHALRLAEQLEAAIRSFIMQKRTQPDATDVLAALIHAHDEDGTKLSDDELIGHTFTLFIAGYETTANALTWTTFLLGQHPRVFADLLDELT